MENQIKRNNQIIHHDEFGQEYVLDEHGNKMAPMTSQKISVPGEFSIYDDRGGHCALCGRLICDGNCFK